MSSARGAVRDAADSAGRVAQETGEEMTRYASQMMNQVSETAASYVASAGRIASDTREGVMDSAHRIADRARTLPEELDEAVQDHPLVLAALGVAVGAALGASLPARLSKIARWAAPATESGKPPRAPAGASATPRKRRTMKHGALRANAASALMG